MKSKKAQGGPTWIVVLMIVVMVTGLVLLGVYTGIFRKIFGGALSPMVNTIGENACAQNYKMSFSLGSSQAEAEAKLRDCCNKLYKDAKDTTLTGKCFDNAKTKDS